MNPYRLVSAITSSGRKQSLRTRRTVAAILAAKETVGRVEYRSATDNAAWQTARTDTLHTKAIVSALRPVFGTAIQKLKNNL
jgi:hypothetical protein